MSDKVKELTDPDSEFSGVHFPIEWCTRYGHPCDLSDNCCGDLETIQVVSLGHALDVEKKLKAHSGTSEQTNQRSRTAEDPVFDLRVSRFGVLGVLEYVGEHELRGREAVDDVLATHLDSFGPSDRMLLELRRRKEDNPMTHKETRPS